MISDPHHILLSYLGQRGPGHGEAWLLSDNPSAGIVAHIEHTLSFSLTVMPSPDGGGGEWLIARRPLLLDYEGVHYVAVCLGFNPVAAVSRLFDILSDVASPAAPELLIIDAYPPLSTSPYSEYRLRAVKSDTIEYDDSCCDMCDAAPAPCCALPADYEAEISERSFDENADDTALESEQKRWLDQLTALVLDYVSRHHTMPPIECISDYLRGKISMADGGVSHIVVNGDMRIILPAYNELELRMTPLVRTLYILFLMHPEGIELKQIGSYADQLREIYLLVKPGADESLARQSIADLTMPGGDSLRQKIAMAKRAVSRYLLNPVIASHYTIAGKRGERYKIAGFPTLNVTLPRILQL